MGFDFSKLEDLKNDGLTTNDFDDISNYADTSFKKEQKERKQITDTYKQHQDNIIKSGQLCTEIIKGAKAGENPYTLLLKAVKCIGLMNGDNAIYDTVKDDIKTLYGSVWLQKDSILIEKSETEERLKKLEIAFLDDNNTKEERARIERAIKAHKEKINLLESKI